MLGCLTRIHSEVELQGKKMANRRNLQRRISKVGVQLTLGALAFFARRRRLSKVAILLARSLALVAVRLKNIRATSELEELGPAWQQAFPSKKQVPIESVDDRTVIAQIHTPCPLRGTGDVHACHRMMAFDREILRRAGGQFVVLDSQATPGRTFCRVAMRLEGESIKDLVPAHERVLHGTGNAESKEGL